MTTILSTKGRVTIPREIRDKCNLRKGDRFLVLCSSTGDIMLRPIHRRTKNWLKCLRAMQGLEIKRIDKPIRN